MSQDYANFATMSDMLILEKNIALLRDRYEFYVENKDLGSSW